MMKTIITIAVILGILLALYLIGKATEVSKEKRFREKIRKNFTRPLDADYSAHRLNAISGYFLRHMKAEYTVDDITWNDLNLDGFIRAFNHSYSSVGDEYLYYRLRCPYLREEESDFRRLEELVLAFEQDEKKREDYQVLMAKLGRSGKFSLYSYLDILKDLPSDKPFLTVIDWMIYIGIIVFMLFVDFVPGLLFLVFWVVVNVIVYLTRKKKIEPYFDCFTYILRMIITSNKVIGSFGADFDPEKEILKKNKARLKSVSSGNLVFLQSSSSSAVGDLGNGLMDFFKMFLQLDIFLFYRIKAQVEKSTDSVDAIFETLGFMDFAINVVSYRNVLKNTSIPDFVSENKISFENMVHPMLLDDGVPNSLRADSGILLTGSNASGKSTFLRMVGLNAIVAQSMHTVYADSYEAGMFRVFTSMSLKDSLDLGESYYMAEIKSIKRIIDASKEEGSRVLCFVDEVLRGTNTKERIAAGAEIMKSLQNGNSICFAATHDIELADILVPEFTNYHFDEEMVEDDIVFPYRLKEGFATSRNAIALLRIMGYPKDIVERALERAKD